MDLTRQLASKTDVSPLIIYFKAARPGILGITDKPLASSDLRARPESLVITAPQVQVMGQRMVRIFGW